MPTTPARRKAVSTAASIDTLILLSTPASPGTATSIVEDDWTLMEYALDILATGDPAARRDVAEDAEDVFDVLVYDSDHDAEDVARVIASLRSLLRLERDDWISYRLLGGLAETELD